MRNAPGVASSIVEAYEDRQARRRSAASTDDRYSEVDEVDEAIHHEIEQYFGYWMSLYEQGVEPMDAETVWVRMLATLMHDTTGVGRKSPYTAVAILKILSDFPYKEIAEFYTRIDPNGIDVHELRRKKRLLFNPLASQYKSFVQTDMKGNEGTRFVNVPATDEHREVVRHLLNLLTFVRPTCLELPPFNPKELDLHEFIRDNLASDSPREIERGRKHIMGHPKCFSEILSALNFGDFFQRLWVMNVIVPDNGRGPSKPPINRNNPPPSPPPGLTYKKKSLGSRRFWTRYSGKPFSGTVRISYGDKSKEFALGDSEMSFGFALKFGNNVIKVADVADMVDNNPRVLVPLDMHFISWEAEGGSEKSVEYATELPGGARLKFSVTFDDVDDGVFTSADVHVAYTPADAHAVARDARPAFGAHVRRLLNKALPLAIFTAFVGGIIGGRIVSNKARREGRFAGVGLRKLIPACLTAIMLSMIGTVGWYGLFAPSESTPVASSPFALSDRSPVPSSEPDSAGSAVGAETAATTGSATRVRAKRHVSIPAYVPTPSYDLYEPGPERASIKRQNGYHEPINDATAVGDYEGTRFNNLMTPWATPALPDDWILSGQEPYWNEPESITGAWATTTRGTYLKSLDGCIDIPVAGIAAHKYALREAPHLSVAGGENARPDCAQIPGSIAELPCVLRDFHFHVSPALPATPAADAAATQHSVGPSIFGSVLDSDGNGVGRAQVFAVAGDTGRKTLAVSDIGGKFSFSLLPDGVYNLTVERAGFERMTIEKASVRAYSPLQLDVRLNAASRALQQSPSAASSVSVSSPTSHGLDTSGVARGDLPPSGEVIDREPGVAKRGFGPGSVRPVVRGRVSSYTYSRLWSESATSQPKPASYVLKRGQLIRVRAVTELSSADAKAGDSFDVSVVVTVHNGRVKVVPVGSLITGRVEGARRATHEDGPGVLDVHFVSLRLPDGSRHKIEGRLADATQAARDRRDYLPDYDFKRKLVFRGGDASRPGTKVVALAETGSDASPRHHDGATAAFVVPSAVGKEATVRRDAEFWVILKKDVKIPPPSR